MENLPIGIVDKKACFFFGVLPPINDFNKGVFPATGAIALTLILKGANSIAMALVAVIIQPLLALYQFNFGLGDKPAVEATDPRRELGYRKSAVALRVVGSYSALHRFLQGMERLQILVESSDLNLTAKESDGLVSQTELALRLSFYDPRPPSAPMEEPQSPAEELS